MKDYETANEAVEKCCNDCLEFELELYRALCAGYTIDELRGRSLTFKAEIDLLRKRRS